MSYVRNIKDGKCGRCNLRKNDGGGDCGCSDTVDGRKRRRSRSRSKGRRSSKRRSRSSRRRRH